MTLGLTDLFGTTLGEDPGVSGWGFELTMRVPLVGVQPPAWALNLLQQLGRYVYSSARPLEAGHRLDPGGPITGQPGTALTAVAFAADPQLGQISTHSGSVQFLAVVGITSAELTQMKQSSTTAVLAELSTASPQLITDPSR